MFSDFARSFDLIQVDTPGGVEYHLTSPWDTVIHKWNSDPGPHEPRRRAILWSATHPESSRPEQPKEVQRSALDRFRNRLASALWVK